MILRSCTAAVTLGLVLSTAGAQEHSHPPPEKLGKVNFETSCSPQVSATFNRAVALLHSFAYGEAGQAFRDVARSDPRCAMAHWGIAQSYYHPLWAPPDAQQLQQGMQEIRKARSAPAMTPRERAFIEAAAIYYQDAKRRPHAERARAYEQAMAAVAARYPEDPEAQIFYALASLSTASPTDTTQAQQKHAAKILEPLYAKFPDHPGLAHYLIHAYDSSELASRGLKAARAYAQIAPSAPHALHMPSHIFTRLGLWEDSVASNLAARQAAEQQGDRGEALHAMDYLTYAYLQLGRVSDAQRIVREARALGTATPEFKSGYAVNAMPVRLAIEQEQWSIAATLQPLANASPEVAAMVYWARAIGQARGGQPQSAADDLAKIKECQDKLQAAGNAYWATQVSILEKEARAWTALAMGDGENAIALMRAAAEEEDAIEKLPVTPGPIVPAREQLGEMLLASGKPAQALREFQAALQAAPQRRGALKGVARAQDASQQP